MAASLRRIGPIGHDGPIRHVILVDFDELTAPDVYARVSGRWQHMRAEPPVMVEGGGDTHDLAALLAVSTDQAPVSRVSSQDPAAILFTSGAHEPSRPVCLTHANLVANAVQMRHWFPDLRYGRVTFLAVAPLYHSYGLTLAVNLPIVMAAPYWMITDFDLYEALAQISAYPPTVFPGVPSMYRAMNLVRASGPTTCIRLSIASAVPPPCRWKPMRHSRS